MYEAYIVYVIDESANNKDNYEMINRIKFEPRLYREVVDHADIIVTRAGYEPVSKHTNLSHYSHVRKHFDLRDIRTNLWLITLEQDAK